MALAAVIGLVARFADERPRAARLFEASLYDADPWRAIGREAAWLSALAAAYALAARAGMRRLSA